MSRLSKLVISIAATLIIAAAEAFAAPVVKTTNQVSPHASQETKNFKVGFSAVAFIAGFIPDFSMEYFFNDKLVFGGNFLLYNMEEKNGGKD